MSICHRERCLEARPVTLASDCTNKLKVDRCITRFVLLNLLYGLAKDRAAFVHVGPLVRMEPGAHLNQNHQSERVVVNPLALQ